jgi:hypothetical protein
MNVAFETGRAGGSSYDVGPRQIGILRAVLRRLLIEQVAG